MLSVTHQNMKSSGDKSKLVRCKSTTRTSVKDKITFVSIIKSLKYNTSTKHDNYCIRFKKHKLGLYKINKVSLSCYDDKRQILKGGITSYARGHLK